MACLPKTKLFLSILLIIRLCVYGQMVAADSFLSHSWDFSDPLGYQYDTDKIEIQNGIARLKTLPLDAGQP